jgi:hypothetical protein
MNEFVRKFGIDAMSPSPSLDGWSKLMKLAEMLEVDDNSGAITIRNGRSSLTLRKDGRVTIEGTSINERAETHISLDAAVINLN